MPKIRSLSILILVLGILLTVLTACGDPLGAGQSGKPITVSDIILDTRSVQLEITAGEPLDLSALIVKTVNSDDSWTVLTEGLSGYTLDLSAFDGETAGVYKIGVSHGVFTKYLEITVLPRVTGIALEKNSAHKTAFLWGESFSASGIAAEKIMSDGTYRSLTANDFTVDSSAYRGVNLSNTSASYKIKVVLKENTAFFTEYAVTVGARPAPVATGIRITAPTKTAYTIGDSLDLTGGAAYIDYDWGESQKISLSDPSIAVSALISSAPSVDQEIIVTHKASGFSAKFKVRVDKKINSIAIFSLPTKLNYSTKEIISLAGGSITVHYNDGTFENSNMNDSRFTVTGYSSNYSTFNKDGDGKIGFKTASVELKGYSFSVSFGYYVAPQVKQLSWTENPSDRYFTDGPNVISGGKIKVLYDDEGGTFYEITLEEDREKEESERELAVSGFSTLEAAANKTASVALKNSGLSLTFVYTVSNDHAVSVDVLSFPAKTEYSGTNNKPDLSGGELKITFSSGDIQILTLPHPDITASHINTNVAGEQTISLKYKDYAAFTKIYKINFTINYTGFEILSAPSVLSYKHNAENYNFAGGKIAKAYDNGTYDPWIDMAGTIFAENYTVTGWDSSAPKTDGVLTITQNSDNLTQTLNYSIVDWVTAFTFIPPGKINYYKGEELDITGAKARITYSYEGESEYDIASGLFDISNFHTNFSGPHSVYIKYVDSGEACASQSFSITVLNRPRLIVLETPLTKTVYYKGESIAPQGGVLKVTYDFNIKDGCNSEEIATDTAGLNTLGADIGGGDANLSGLRVAFPDFTTAVTTDSNGRDATIDFGGAQTTFNYKVNKRVSGIAWKNQPASAYITGEAIKLSYGSINIIYENTDYAAVDLEADQKKPSAQRLFSISGFDSSVAGIFSYTVTHTSSYSVTLQYSVSAPAVTEMEIFSIPNLPAGSRRIDFLFGEASGYSGIKVRRYFNNNAEDTVTLPCADKIEIIGFYPDALTGGAPRTLTLKAVGTDVTNTEITYTVSDWVSGLFIDSYPSKTVYYKGDTETALNGGAYHLLWASGLTSESYLMTSETFFAEGLVTTSKLTVEDDAKITLTFRNPGNLKIKDTLTAFYNYTVSDKIASVALTANPAKTVYYIGQGVNLNGAEVTVYYDFDDPSTFALPNPNFTAELDTSTPTTGEETRDIIITHTDTSLQCGFPVRVYPRTLQSITISKAPIKLQYFKNEIIDLTGGELKLNYSAGEADYLSMTASGVTLSGGNTQTVSPSVAVTLSYKGIISSAFYIEVVRSLETIALDVLPKTVFKKGETLSLAGGTLLLNYDDASAETLPLTSENVTVAGFDSSAFGEQALTVSYNGKVCAYTIEVKPFITALSIAVCGTQEFEWGTPFNSIGLSVLATFDHDPESLGNPREISAGADFYFYGIDIGSFKQDVAGTYEIKVYWQFDSAVYTSYSVTVNASAEIQSVSFEPSIGTLTGYQNQSYEEWQANNPELCFKVTYTDSRVEEVYISEASSNYEAQNAEIASSVTVTFSYLEYNFFATFDILANE